MNRLFEWLFGTGAGFLSRDGQLSFAFDPQWPLEGLLGTFTWNVVLLAFAGFVAWYIYLRRPEDRRANAIKAALRFGVFVLVIVLLNRPRLTVTQSQIEPSVLAVLIDDSLSMRLADVKASPDAPPEPRLDAIVRLLTADDSRLVRELAAIHRLRFYRFNADAVSIEPPADTRTTDASDRTRETIGSIEPSGGQTRVVESLQTVTRELQGQRLAGIVLFTDGRETAKRDADAVRSATDSGIKIYAVPVGTDAGLKNVEIDSAAVQDSVFVGDIVNVKVAVRGTGVSPATPVRVQLRDKGGTPMLEDGAPVERTVTFSEDEVQSVELQFVPQAVGPLDLVVVAIPLDGEIDEADNTRTAQLTVLDANIRVLYVEGTPRWEYRYLKQQLIRDPTIVASCLLMSADASFAQEGDRPITRFPETIDELMEYDVVVIGDVDPRQFTDAQLALVNEFVSRRGGGLGMISGPAFAPHRYVNTAIEPVLPVDITRVDVDAWRGQNLANGFRIALTEEGRDSAIFRFFRDPTANADFIRDRIQELFWYVRGVTAKPGVGVVLAQHPRDTGPDGRPAALTVTGRFGTGRTFFSAIDDSWRWRYYTGESVFDSYWVQTLRYLARGKKLGQRQLTLETERPSYQLGEMARVSARVLDPQLLVSLPDQISGQVLDEQGRVVRDVQLIRQLSGDTYAGGFAADRIGQFVIRVSPSGSTSSVQVPVEIDVPQLELNDPTVDRVTLARLAAESGGKLIDFVDAGGLARLIPTAQKEIPIVSERPLWSSPLAMILFVSLLTIEWILRKRAGMV